MVNMNEIQLAAIVGALHEQLVQRCEYHGDAPSVDRIRVSQSISVYRADTGRRIAQHTFRGGTPGRCRSEEDWNRTSIVGEPPTFEEEIEWINQYAHPVE